MKLQTKIPLQTQLHNQIDYYSKTLLLGSCFSENVGNKFKYFKFQSAVNPFGILFHPLAIENLITRSINKDYYSESELHFQNEQWCCLETHSKLKAESKDELMNVLNTQIDKTNKQLCESTHVIITLGTSWVYKYIVSDKIVANCHKIPQKQFLKELLSVEQISESIEAIISLVKSVNPKINLIFTVSPVRHTKDGFVENTQSKAHLISAIHTVLSPRALTKSKHVLIEGNSQGESRGLSYFPSYEIMMDELRDYRFYAEDMIHPNQSAINYIWEKFQQVWISDETLQTMEEVDAIQKGLQHKPFNPNAEAHHKFLQNLEEKKKTLQLNFPHFKF